MGIDETHLVRKAVTNAGDHVLDDAADGTQARDVLAGAVPDDELDLVDGLDGLVRRGEDADRHVGVLQVLLQGTARAGDGDNTGLDGNRDALPVFFGSGGSAGRVQREQPRTGRLTGSRAPLPCRSASSVMGVNGGGRDKGRGKQKKKGSARP